MIKHLPPRTAGYKVEDTMHDMYDDEDGTPVVALEMFGPQDALVWDSREDTWLGPWVVGHRDEAYEYAQAQGVDFEEQYSIDRRELEV